MASEYASTTVERDPFARGSTGDSPSPTATGGSPATGAGNRPGVCTHTCGNTMGTGKQSHPTSTVSAMPVAAGLTAAGEPSTGALARGRLQQRQADQFHDHRHFARGFCCPALPASAGGRGPLIERVPASLPGGTLRARRPAGRAPPRPSPHPRLDGGRARSVRHVQQDLFRFASLRFTYRPTRHAVA